MGEFYGQGERAFGQNVVQANSYEIYLSKITNPSQRFTRIAPDDALGLQYSHNAWLDFEGDGDLDFVVTGANSTNDLHTFLYENIKVTIIVVICPGGITDSKHFENRIDQFRKVITFI